MTFPSPSSLSPCSRFRKWRPESPSGEAPTGSRGGRCRESDVRALCQSMSFSLSLLSPAVGERVQVRQGSQGRRLLSPPAARILLPHLRRAVVAAPPPPVVAPSPLPVSCGRTRSIGRGGAPFPLDPTSTSEQMAPTAAASTRAHAHHVPAPVTSQVSGPSPRR